MKFAIVLVHGNPFSRCFDEVAETLMYGLRGLGHQAEITASRLHRDAKNIILGAHLLSPYESIPNGAILYNLEQPGSDLFSIYVARARAGCQMWDYSEGNIARWQSLGIPAVHVPIGYVPELSRVSPQDHDIDVLFYGSVNDRRAWVLNEVQAAGLRVQRLFGVFGAERDDAIARSKVVLNLHYYDSKIFEIARVSYLLANRKAVVSEESVDMAADAEIGKGMLIVPYSGLVEACVRVVRDDTLRQQMERDGFELFSKIDEKEILQRVAA